VPHFTAKAKIDRIVKEAGFAHHTFIIATFFYQNVVGTLAPQKQADGSLGWALPIDPTVRGIHMGDIREIGNIVAGAFARPDRSGHDFDQSRHSDEAEFRCSIDSLGASLDRQLPKDAFCMRLDCLGSDTQLAGDHFVGQPVPHQEHDRAFACRQARA